VHNVKVGAEWRPAANLADPAADAAALAGATPRIVTLTIRAIDADETEIAYEDLGFDRNHPRWVGHLLAPAPSRRADQLQNLYAINIGANVSTIALHTALFNGIAPAGNGLLTRTVVLTGGVDGSVPGTAGYALALGQIAGLEDVSIVAAPGAAAYPDAAAVNLALIAHAESRRAYRIAVLDTPPGQTPGDVRTQRGQMDSRYAALYYPWVVVSNPLARPGREDIPREIALPPSSFVAGIYARNDIQRGVYKAPANEVVRSALRFEIEINFGQQEMLNPIGVNCLRLLSGRGYRVWGARLVSSDPEWKYVSDRRYFNYLEASIDRGTQWAVFEPNGERLWANVRQTISDFLYNEWSNGALLGTTQEEAFFVRCDRSTMTQNDLDNGRLVCLIGIAIVKPAEFVIFRIGQKTVDARA
jgi:phage tail sheath protein FI